MPRKRPTPKTAAPTLQAYVEAFCDAPLTRGAVTQLSALLARVIGAQIGAELPEANVEVGERSFGGSVGSHHLDAWVANPQLGMQLGVDVKGLNSASSVGKNWRNRVGDLGHFATNHHGVFPKAVMGGVLAIPLEGISPGMLHLIERAMSNLCGRRAVANAHNVLECASLIVISKEQRIISAEIPAPGSPLRVEVFAKTMADVYRQRWL